MFRRVLRVRGIRKPAVLASVVLLAASVFAGKRIAELATDPRGEKTCPPLFPEWLEGDESRIIFAPHPATLPWRQIRGYIDDASCLDRTAVYGIVAVRTEEDIRNALAFAREHNLKVSLAGVRHSMGGHAFARGALVLDMRGYNQMRLDEERKILTVQSGATWHDIQNFLHPRFAVRAMQSSDIFTVGGSLAVNAHGMDHRVGSLANTLKSFRLMLPDGSVVRVSRTENAELFPLVVGGYGLFGVVLDAEIEVTENPVLESRRELIDYQQFPRVFQERIEPDPSIELFYGHLSTAPGKTFLRELLLYTYVRKADAENLTIPPLEEVRGVKLRRFIFNLAKQGAIPMKLKWWAEKRVEPLFESCAVSRNQAMASGEACLVSRNEPMHDSVPYLRNNLRNETDILQEYYIPRGEFVGFVDDVRRVLERYPTIRLLNASVRVVHAERDILLNYSPQESFAIVLYLNQPTTPEGNAIMRSLTQELIDAVHKHGGKFFLPYQPHYTTEQLLTSYPNLWEFLAAKLHYDPHEVLESNFYRMLKERLQALGVWPLQPTEDNNATTARTT